MNFFLQYRDGFITTAWAALTRSLSRRTTAGGKTPPTVFTSEQFNPKLSFLTVLHADGRVAHVNEAALSASGVAAEQVLGKLFWETTWWSGLPSARAWPERLKTTATTGHHHVSVDEFRGREGELRTARVAVTAMRDGSGTTKYLLVETHDITESRQTESALKETEAMVLSAQRVAKLGSWSWDERLDQLSWSPDAFRIFGLPQDEFESLTLTKFLQQIHPDDRFSLQQCFEQALPGRVFRYEYRFCAKDGGEKLIRGDAEAQFGDQGKVLRLVGTVVDVTEQEEMRQAVQRSKELVSSLTHSSTEWHWEQDDEFRFTRITGGRIGKLTPHPVDVMIGKRRWELPNSAPLTSGWEEHRATLSARRSFSDFEFQVVVGDAIRCVSTSGSPMYGTDGRFIGYRGTAQDITQHKLVQARARKTESLLRLATRLSRLGAWTVDVPEMTVTWSSETLAIYEIEDESPLTFERIAALIHLDWQEDLHRAMQRCIGHGLPFDIEVRAHTTRRTPIWLRLIGQPERDIEGRVKRIQVATQDISERKDADERLCGLSKQLTTTLESVSDAFIALDRQWRFTYLNGAAEGLFNESRERMLGKVIWELFPKSVGSVFHREYERALTESTTVRFEAFSDSVGRWLRVVAYPSPQGLAICCKDVTESRNVRHALIESEERYRLIFETSMDAILQTAFDGKILRANSAACAMFAMSEGELQNVGRDDLIAPEETRLVALIEARNKSGKAMGELTMVRSDGSRFDAEVTTSRYCMSNGTVLTNAVLRDITERLQLQQEILVSNAELGQRVQQRTAELEIANAELKGFAHALAHDLRAPIATIKGFSEALELSLAKAGSEREQHYVRRIHAASQRMDEFAAALLSLASISQAQMNSSEVDLSAIANSILADLHERDQLRVVVCTIQEGMQSVGDARLLRMALENLLGNAWKFTSKRETAQIAFNAQLAPDGQLVYCVKDNGAGFDMAYAQKLFGNFQRLHRETEFPGTGIGLANVRMIVRRHGGRIWAQAVEGEGASFHFTLGTAPTGLIAGESS